MRKGGFLVGFSQSEVAIDCIEQVCYNASNVGLRPARLPLSGGAPEQQDMLLVPAPITPVRGKMYQVMFLCMVQDTPSGVGSDGAFER